MEFSSHGWLQSAGPLHYEKTRCDCWLSFRISLASWHRSVGVCVHASMVVSVCGYLCELYTRVHVSSSSAPPPSPTPVPTMHVLVVLRELESKENTSPPSAAGCLAEIYELSSSPWPSPLTSPLPCTAGVCCDQSSPLTTSLTNRRNSLTTLATS